MQNPSTKDNDLLANLKEAATIAVVTVDVAALVSQEARPATAKGEG